MSVTSILASVGLILANAFFVAAEFALVGARRTRIEAMAESGNRSARVALGAMQDLSRQLAGAQLGITMASLALGFVAEPAIAHVLEDFLHDASDLPEGVVATIGLVVALSIVSFFHMVIGEMVPKNLAIAGAERMLLILARPMRLYSRLFSPIIVSLNAIANGVMRLLKVEPADELATAATPEELSAMFAESKEEGTIGDEEHGLLSRALGWSRITAGQVMSPLDSVAAVDRLTPVADVEVAAVSDGRARVPVRSPDGRTLLGFVHLKDLLELPDTARTRPVPLARIRPMVRLSETATLPDMLLTMRRARNHLAVVEDTHHQPVGVVELDEVLLPLVGDSHDVGAYSDRDAAETDAAIPGA